MESNVPVGLNQFTVQIDALGQSKGRSYCRDVVIKRTFTGSKSLFRWFKSCRDKAVTKSNGSVIVKDDHGKITCQFDFTNAWPISWRGPDFFAGDESGTAQESVVLSIESLELR